jgi:two-component system, chemotaxis family, protein-glutamate methylesterase/glutaminase
MANRDIVAVGTSAGGVEAILFLAKRFAPDLPATVLITIHLATEARSFLDQLLSRARPLPAAFASGGETLRAGHILIAQAGRHLLVDGNRTVLGFRPRENNPRPAIDPMLRSAAVCCGPRSIGVVLTGTLGDGGSGLRAITQCGGISVVQDPEDAAFSEMPLMALNRSMPHHVVHLDEMPGLLDKLAHHPAGEAMFCPESMKFEVEVAKGARAGMKDMDKIGRRSVLTCPDCNGVMWEIDADADVH